ncbi:hypothetical protein EG327_004883 [Venturia inaequalis]|uniref:Uncharacterized protein n=1 Tax=Venturia inaequalis TaxID=5025 RepID=A0A8H3V7V7_VENIN|nr:hypothetical protein EG327_004883 [Venturia inaequalis]
MNGERAKDHGALAGGLPSIQGRPCKKRSWVEDTLAAGKLDKYGRVNDKTPAKWRPARGKKALRPDCQLRHDPVVSRRHLLSIFVRSRWPKKDLIVNEILVMREGKHETSGRPNRGLTALDNSHSSLIFISAFLLKNYSGLLLKNYKMELELELGGDIDGHNKFVTPLPASLDSQCASLDIWKMQPYDIPAVETTYSSHPDSAYGSPQNVGRLPMSPTEKDLSVLDALHPASFDSQGVSHYIARECYFCSTISAQNRTLETLNTLKLAFRAKDNIFSHEKKAKDAFGGAEDVRSRALRDRYRMEIDELKKQLMAGPKQVNSTGVTASPISDETHEIFGIAQYELSPRQPQRVGVQR